MRRKKNLVERGQSQMYRHFCSDRWEKIRSERGKTCSLASTTNEIGGVLISSENFSFRFFLLICRNGGKESSLSSHFPFNPLFHKKTLEMWTIEFRSYLCQQHDDEELVAVPRVSLFARKHISVLLQRSKGLNLAQFNFERYHTTYGHQRMTCRKKTCCRH